LSFGTLSNGTRSTLDSDGDSIPNLWESFGLDPDANRANGVGLPFTGASPGHKDLFVEVDAMAGRAPVALPGITNITATTPMVVTSNFHGLSTGTRVTI